jgi:hypothetical protein
MVKEAFDAGALGMAKVDGRDHQHAGGPTLDDVAQRTWQGSSTCRNICKSQRTVVTLWLYDDRLG